MTTSLRTILPGLCVAWLVATAAVAQAPVRLAEVWRLAEGLDRPESVVYDPVRRVLYVSNIRGVPSEKDGNGYVARVALDGRMVDSTWVTGLDAPKGLAFDPLADRLYAADLDALLAIDPGTGEVVARHAVEGPAYLNDVTVAADGTVYVSDSRHSRLYRLDDAGLAVWLDDAGMRMPNGVHVVEDYLVVAAGDTTAENPGAARYLHSVSRETRQVLPLSDRTPRGALDAVEPDGHGAFFVTDWAGGTVLFFPPEGEPLVLRQLGQGTADLEYVAEGAMLYVPVMMSNALVAFRVVE